MYQEFLKYFSSDDFIPHGHCFLWLPRILWLHVVSDALIALAYYSIPLSLLYFIRNRRDLPFRTLFSLFGSFILLCGTTHILAIWVIWHPDYAIEGVVKALTAIVSVFTAIISWKIIPQALELKSPGELARLNSQLAEAYAATERKVEERTAELSATNERLQESQEQLQGALSAAEAANTAKSEFMANMSHEIRTPMNAVIGLSHILAMSQPLTPKQQEYIETLRMSADSLLGLIKDLLDIAKIEAHTVELEQVPFSVTSVMLEIVNMMTVSAKEKKLSFTLDCTAVEGRQYIGDPSRLRQILVNLCGNAIKFTERGSVHLTISRRPGARGDSEVVCFTVRDTGIGIAPDKLETIFDKFVQADTSINRRYGGTGLGLAITKSLTEMMGGTITVQSDPGKGTEFEVRITLKSLSARAHKDSPELSPQAHRDNQPAHQPHVLLVEDYAANVMVASAFLEEFGYKVDVAKNGYEAVDMVAHKDYAAVLMDVQMHGMNGFEATKAIREREHKNQLARVPIIGMTAHALAGDRERCIASGMDDYIAKPFNPDELREKLSAVATSKI